MKYIFILIVFLISFNSFSQKKGFSGGLFAGGVTSQVDGDTYGGYHKFGVDFGIFTRFNFNKEWFGTLEISFINKGSKYKDPQYGCYTLIVNYIEMPIYVTFKPEHIKNITQLSFDLGLAPAVLVNAKEDTKCLDPVEPKYYNVRKFDVSTLVGVNWHFTEKIRVGVRFLYTIIPIKDNEPFNFYKSGSYNNVLVLNLFYTI